MHVRAMGSRTRVGDMGEGMKVYLMASMTPVVGEVSMWQNYMGREFSLVNSYAEADIVFVMVVTEGNLKFNQELREVVKSKKYVIVDYLEYGSNFDPAETHVVGRNRGFSYNEPAWNELHEFVRDNPPVLYFKREVLKKDVSDFLKPVEYWNYFPQTQIVSKQEFDARRVEVLHFWGLSHSSRPKLHGDIYKNYEGKYEFISQWKHIDWHIANSNNKLWASIHTPHYDRANENTMQKHMTQSKITVSLSGCGAKCFRHGEACAFSIMAHHCELAFSHPWDGTNSICLRPGHEWEDLWTATQKSDLYDIYRLGMENANKYRPYYYARDYMTPEVEKALCR